MNGNELDRYADLIFSILFNKENAKKNNDELKCLIKPIIMQIAIEEKRIGRAQVLNHIKSEIVKLEG